MSACPLPHCRCKPSASCRCTSCVLLRRWPMTADEKERQRRSFAFGNVNLSNENVTREMVDEAAERLKKP